MVLAMTIRMVTAQTDGAGSYTADNSMVEVGSGTVELRFSETSYFGPNAHWIIHGTLEIWSKRILIAPWPWNRRRLSLMAMMENL